MSWALQMHFKPEMIIILKSLTLFARCQTITKVQLSDFYREVLQTVLTAKIMMRQHRRQLSLSRHTGLGSMANLNQEAFWIATRPNNKVLIWIARVEKAWMLVTKMSWRRASWRTLAQPMLRGHANSVNNLPISSLSRSTRNHTRNGQIRRLMLRIWMLR